MTAPALAAGAAALLAAPLVVRLTSRKPTHRWAPAWVAAGVLAAAGLLSWLDTAPLDTAARLWLQAAVLSGALAAALVEHWLRFHAGQFLVSLPMDFLSLAGVTAGLTACLLMFAARLFALQPFPALLLGILAFFLPLNALAEVFHAGAAHRKRR